MGAHGGRGAARRRPVRRYPFQRLRPELGGVGVQAQDDLRLARLDEAGKPVGERRRCYRITP